VVNTVPTEMTTELAQLRYNLFIEEVQELKAAVEANDRVEQLDALCDTLYIVMGTANSMGMDTQDLQDKIGFIHSPFVQSMDEQFRSEGMETLVGHLEILNVKEVGASVIAVFILTRLLGFTPETFNEAFRRVHISNMSKFYLTEEDCYVDQCELRRIDGIETYIRKNGDFYVLYRATDGKVLKGNRYKPVDLTDLI